MSKLLKQLYYFFVLDYVLYDSLPLPEKHLRTGGKEFKQDDYYVRSARMEVRRLKKHFGLEDGFSLLDIGCGYGRLATGFLDASSDISYTGIDVNPSAIAWCQKHLESASDHFKFVHINAQNARYNPDGVAIDKDFQLPFEANQFDIAYLYSVFSHMVKDDIQVYLKELRRVLKDGGVVFFTAFVERNVPDMTINPKQYGAIQWKSELHCVRYSMNLIKSLLAENDMWIDEYEYGTETDGQSGFYVSIKK